MKCVAIVLLLAVAAQAARPQRAVVVDHNDALVAEFGAYVAKFEKKYESHEEHLNRMNIYADNMQKAADMQANELEGGSGRYGATQFSDLTADEFKAQFLGLSTKPSVSHLPQAPLRSTNDIPADFDWTSKGGVTGVKNQGQCGSCWSFSTTGCIEGANFIKNGKLVSLSEQELVDCDHECDPQEPDACDAGCNGGLPSNAMSYVMKNGGIDTEESYPYNAFAGDCAAKTGTKGASITNFTIVSTDEDQMAATMVAAGPLSIGIDAAWMQSYVGGVACPYICSKTQLDHGVLIVGYGAKGFAPTHLQEMPFWKIKNSWGTTWGEEGYYKICKGSGACGLNQMVVSATA